jgi:hypothetical protein
MLQSNLIPVLDPNPLPAPYWLLKLLLIVTFTLHIVAMNFMLGGAVLALTAKWSAKHREHGKRVFFDVAKKLPSLLPATITLGIAPLLFLQVLYGQFFYTSSIIMAWPWFLVLVLLTVAYYGFYFVSFRSGRDSRKVACVMLVSTLLVVLVGFVFSNNITLSQTPARWAAKYFAHPSGWNLNLTEPTLIPRFLHFFVAAVAVGGLLLVFMALAAWKRDNAYARQLLNFGGKAFLFSTMAQFVVGPLFLFTLPRDLRMMFMGDNPLATTLLLVGIAGGVAALVVMSSALRNGNIRAAAFTVPGLVAVVIASMAVMRDLLRDAYLKPYFHPEQFPVKTQWQVLPLFLALFVGGVALWLVMIWRYGLLGGRSTIAAEASNMEDGGTR